MKLKTKLMMFTAAAALSANFAFAQATLDPQALANTFLADGYTYVEVKVGPTQTKLEAVQGTTKIEVIYDNVTGLPIKTETETADDDYLGRTGVEIEMSDEDFEDDEDDEEDDDLDEEEDDDLDDDEGDDADEDDDEDDSDESDESDDDEDDDSDDSDDDDGEDDE